MYEVEVFEIFPTKRISYTFYLTLLDSDKLISLMIFDQNNSGKLLATKDYKK